MELTSPHPKEDRWVRQLFFALTLLSAVPFWTVQYLPTLDGPCHTYNAWILRQLGNVEQYPLFQAYYEVNARPYPNWTGHGVMALLMFVVPPLVAEKLLVSGYMLLFLGGMWYLVGAVRPEERWLAFLAFPFAWNQTFQFGFYNFALSLALFPWILGCWWRNRAAPGLGFAVKINLLLWLCYFSHILSFALALAAIGILWLAMLWRARLGDWRRHLLHVLILLPQVVLPVWFFLQNTGGEIPDGWGLGRLVRYFTGLRVLVTLSEAQRWVGRGVASLFLLLLLLTLGRKVRRRPFFAEQDAFLFLAVLGVLLYAWSPQGLAGGSLLKPRLSLYPWLLLIPWFSPGLSSGRVRRAATVSLALGALVYLGYMTHLYRVGGAEVERFLAALEPVQPNTRILPVFFEHARPTPFLNHAIDYKALEKGLVDWDNYEANHSFFPTRYRRSVVFPEVGEYYSAPEKLRPVGIVDRVDAVYTWKMPPRHVLRKRLRRHYERVSERFGGELYEVRQSFDGSSTASQKVGHAGQGTSLVSSQKLCR